MVGCEIPRALRNNIIIIYGIFLIIIIIDHDITN